jgi:four helix bundle protein
MEKKYVKLHELECYRSAAALSDKLWYIVANWEAFAKNTVGAQYVRAMDSISANIAEGFGRRGKKDKIKFYLYSRGSVMECLDWNLKAKNRGLLNQEDYNYLYAELMKLPKSINAVIKYTNSILTE